MRELRLPGPRWLRGPARQLGPSLRLASLGLLTLAVGCAAPVPRAVSLECDVLGLTPGYVLVTGISSERSPNPEVTGFFVEVRTPCSHGEHRVAPPSDRFAEIRSASGRRPLRVERSGLFRAAGVVLADTLVFGGGPFEAGSYAITVGEAVASYARDRRARALVAY